MIKKTCRTIKPVHQNWIKLTGCLLNRPCIIMDNLLSIAGTLSLTVNTSVGLYIYISFSLPFLGGISIHGLLLKLY